MSIFDEFDKKFSIDLSEVDKCGAKSSSFEDVPAGKYEVKIEKLELASTQAGEPKMFVQFRIVSDKCYNRIIFWHHKLVAPYPVHLAKEFLNSLKSGVPVDFQSYAQFAGNIQQVFTAISGKLEYGLDYSIDAKGYHQYKITDVFDVTK